MREHPHADPADAGGEHPGAGDEAQRVVERDALLRALSTLTTRERTVLVLRYGEDLSEADTAHLLGVSRGTVKSTSSRALARLRRASPSLSPICPEPS